MQQRVHTVICATPCPCKHSASTHKHLQPALTKLTSGGCPASTAPPAAQVRGAGQAGAPAADEAHQDADWDGADADGHADGPLHAVDGVDLEEAAHRRLHDDDLLGVCLFAGVLVVVKHKSMHGGWCAQGFQAECAHAGAAVSTFAETNRPEE